MNVILFVVSAHRHLLFYRVTHSYILKIQRLLTQPSSEPSQKNLSFGENLRSGRVPYMVWSVRKSSVRWHLISLYVLHCLPSIMFLPDIALSDSSRVVSH